MRSLRTVWKSMFDIREGELARTLSMSLYLMFVMFAYYILKPVSRAMFLTEFKVDRLPYLNMLIAAGGGVLAYVYSRFAIRASLQAAVTWSMAIAAACLVMFWWLVSLPLPWLLYAFNLWVSLFSAVMVSQGWLVAGNLFDARSAKRLYGLLGLGAVIGAAFGGIFTAFTARLIGSRNLLLAAAVLVTLAYGAFRLALTHAGFSLGGARGRERENDFSLSEVVLSITSSRHLQLIVAIFSLTFIVATLVDFQFQAMAAAAYKGDRLAAFFGRFQGVYVNLVTLPLQFLLTAAVVQRLGVGGTLQIMPAAIGAAATIMIAAPGLGPAAAQELSESATRYTVNRTGMELLYLPLPAALRNRTKAFIDVFVDRMSRGLGGVLLAVLLACGIRDVRQIAAVAMALCALWIFLCLRAKHAYLQTVRGRLAHRRLELETSRINVNDPATLALLEETAASANPRQACYALGLLAEAIDYDPGPLLRRLAASPLPAVRGKVYEVAWFLRFSELYDAALQEVRAAAAGHASAALKPAVEYAFSFAAEPAAAARKLIDHPHAVVAETALQALRLAPLVAREVLTAEWVTTTARAASPQRRRLAALAVSLRGDRDTLILDSLLRDSDSGVLAAAFQAAAALGERGKAAAIIERLADARLRSAAIDALAAFGPAICGTLADMLEDAGVPISVRRQIPRVLRLIPSQRSVDVLLKCVGHQDISLRAAVLRALNRLREKAPELDYGGAFLTRQILTEARHYFELHAALLPIASERGARTATGLLARTLELRCAQTIDRLFWLLGLCYPQREIRAAYRSLRKNRREEMAAALEFLENILDHSLRRVVLPLLDSAGRVIEKGQALFGVEVGSSASAIGELVRCGDPWLVACAMAAAAEQHLQHLAPDIEEAGRAGGEEVAEVARSASAALAG